MRVKVSTSNRLAWFAAYFAVRSRHTRRMRRERCWSIRLQILRRNQRTKVWRCPAPWISKGTLPLRRTQLRNRRPYHHSHNKFNTINIKLHCERVQTRVASPSNSRADGSLRLGTPWSVGIDDMDIIHERGAKRKASCRSFHNNYSPDCGRQGRSHKCI